MVHEFIFRAVDAGCLPSRTVTATLITLYYMGYLPDSLEMSALVTYFRKQNKTNYPVIADIHFLADTVYGNWYTGYWRWWEDGYMRNIFFKFVDRRKALLLYL